MAQIDEHGVTGTTLREYLDMIRQAHLDIDPAWNINPESPDGLRIAIEAELLANLDEQVQMAYQSLDPDSAVGRALDRLALLAGLTRQDATASTATVVFSGVPGTPIPEGTKVRNRVTDTTWRTDSTVTIAPSGSATVNVTCETFGAQTAGPGDLSVIHTPVGGVTSVTNAGAASLGSNEESDTLFRVRRNLSVARPSNNQLDSMFAELANLDGVKRVKIYENFEKVADGNGVDPNSMAVFVDGGDVDEIARGIAARKAPGCGLNGGNSYSNKVQVWTTTPRGNPLQATFFRPSITNVYVAVQVSGNIGPGEVASIKSSIVKFANAALFDAEGVGFDRTGFDIGEVIAAGKLYTPVNRVVGDRGHTLSVLIGTSAGSVTQTLIDPGFNGLGVFDANNITVTVV